jgi:hypothetical protein
MCVQDFDDSLNSAIHTTYRISLRSSSLREPRYPLLKVVSRFLLHTEEISLFFLFSFGLKKKKKRRDIYSLSFFIFSKKKKKRSLEPFFFYLVKKKRGVLNKVTVKKRAPKTPTKGCEREI